jgi:hypothetical protein
METAQNGQYSILHIWTIWQEFGILGAALSKPAARSSLSVLPKASRTLRPFLWVRPEPDQRSAPKEAAAAPRSTAS